MPDCGFGRCDGHHKMIDFRLEKKQRLALGECNFIIKSPHFFV